MPVAVILHSQSPFYMQNNQNKHISLLIQPWTCTWSMQCSALNSGSAGVTLELCSSLTTSAHMSAPPPILFCWNPPVWNSALNRTGREETALCQEQIKGIFLNPVELSQKYQNDFKEKQVHWQKREWFFIVNISS